MLNSIDHANLRNLERLHLATENKNIEGALSLLRESLGLTAFGELLMSMPNSEYPSLSSSLPRFSNENVQRSWTGNCGPALLGQSLDFARYCAATYTESTGKSLKNASILDFGCGWGRLSRIFYYFTSYSNLIAVDPWIDSIIECNSCDLIENYLQSAYIPDSLPVDNEMRIDFAYSFSVFTHLNEQAARACLRTISRYLSPNGFAIITIRPPEFWSCQSHVSKFIAEHNIDTQALVDEYHATGFSFLSSGGAGDASYGDAAISPKWIELNLPSMKIVSMDHSDRDPMQIYVGLKPVS
jgi:SAM-dependent methyltransferase